MVYFKAVRSLSVKILQLQQFVTHRLFRFIIIYETVNCVYIWKGN
jgi:hypothetical protein